jgi:hypothetical protein
VSSAILLAAIVAIWACALVPRWVRRGHEGAAEVQDLEQEAFEMEEAYPDDGTLDAGEVYPAEQAYEAQAYEVEGYEAEGYEAEGEATFEAGASYQAEASYRAEADCRVEAGYRVEVTETAEVTERSEPVAHFVAAGGPGHTRPAARPSAGRPSPAEPVGRTRALRARRRTLTMLITLVIATVIARIVGLAQSWVVIAGVVMLGTYLLVLRAAVHAEAENASRRAAAQARAVARSRALAAARAARVAAAERERAREAAEAQAPEQTAEIIDISAHTAHQGGEFYDQYEDATARAIGD